MIGKWINKNKKFMYCMYTKKSRHADTLHAEYTILYTQLITEL